MVGNAGNDVLAGLNADDILRGGSGDDTLNGGAGVDIIDGGFGDDVISGDDGDDILIVSQGSDQYSANGGTDTIYTPELAPLMTIGAGAQYATVEITSDGEGNVFGSFPDGATHTFRQAGGQWVPFTGDDANDA